MGVTIEQRLHLKEGTEVKDGVIESRDVAQVYNVITATCDDPQCGKGGEERHRGTPTKLTWNEATEEDSAVPTPDDAYRFLRLELFDGQKFLFCKLKCLVRFMDKHPKVLSPAEQAQ